MSVKIDVVTLEYLSYKNKWLNKRMTDNAIKLYGDLYKLNFVKLKHYLADGKLTLPTATL